MISGWWNRWVAGIRTRFPHLCPRPPGPAAQRHHKLTKPPLKTGAIFNILVRCPNYQSHIRFEKTKLSSSIPESEVEFPMNMHVSTLPLMGASLLMTSLIMVTMITILASLVRNLPDRNSDSRAVFQYVVFSILPFVLRVILATLLANEI